jgi:DNA-binding beta-propeller fold protein YncE
MMIIRRKNHSTGGSAEMKRERMNRSPDSDNACPVLFQDCVYQWPSVLVALHLLCLMSLPGNAMAEADAFPTRSVSHLFDIGGFALPSDLVVANEKIYIVDGGLNRVVITDLNGQVVDQWGGHQGIDMKGPVGIDAGRDGSIYVCDSGNSRILMFDDRGNMIRQLPVTDPRGRKTRPVDVLIDSERQALHVSDGANHQLLSFSLDGQFLSHWGSRGIQAGYFRYPATLGQDHESLLYVVDVMNARVQRFTPDGEFESSIGSWGVLPGRLFRPKGVALDGEGKVYITDSFMDLIQVFRDEQFQYVLGTEDGQTRKFVSPGGIHIQADRLYVVEMFAKKVGVYQLL